jgi:RNA polymerase sigma-70 factor (ECF subfamily)
VTTRDLAAVVPPAAVAPLDRVAAGRPDFEVVVAPLYAPLVRRLVLVLGDASDAEDIAQEAYLAAFRAWGAFDGTDPRAWLYTIALRRAFDSLRRRRRWLTRLASRPDEGSYQDRVDPDLWAAIGALEPRVRAALLASVIDGYTQREIGWMLGVPEGTVASWLSRARTTLRTALEER